MELRNLESLLSLFKEVKEAIAPGNQSIEISDADLDSPDLSLFDDIDVGDGTVGTVRRQRRVKERRDRLLKIWLTAAEEQELMRLCQGMSKAHYVRSRIFDSKDSKLTSQIKLTPQINREIYVQLSRIALILKQQTGVINRAIARILELEADEGADEGIDESILDESILRDLLSRLHELTDLLSQVRLELLSSARDIVDAD